MTIAIPDPDLPFNSGGFNCGVSEVEGMQVVAEECRNQSGLFWRVSCGNNIELDITDENLKIRAFQNEFIITEQGVKITGPVEIIGPTKITGTTTIAGDTKVTGKFDVTGDSVFTGDVTISDELVVDGITVNTHRHTYTGGGSTGGMVNG